MEKPRPDDDNTQEKTIILISSLLAWDQTPRNLEEIRSPEDVEEEERLEREAAAKAKADAEAARKAEEGPVDEDGNPIEKEEGEAAVAEGEAAEGEAAAADGEDVTSKKEGESAAVAEGDATVLSQKEEEEQKEEPAPVVRKRKRYLHHPFTEKDYMKRRASAEYTKIKEVEDQVLSFKKEGVKTFVISAGVLYGLGEAIFNHHFERAWKQDPEKLPVIGEGKNHMPTIHVKDLARMVKKIFEAPPEQKYIFGIDNTKKPTQKKLIQAVSDGIGTGLIEPNDIPLEYANVHPKQTPLNLHLDWKKFVMLNIKAKPSTIFVQDGGAAGDDEGADEDAAADEGGF